MVMAIVDRELITRDLIGALMRLALPQDPGQP